LAVYWRGDAKVSEQRVDVTNVMAAEAELMTVLREWRDAGAPVVEVVDRIGRLIDAKLELAARQEDR
jgi:hypothetical protein